MKYTEKINLFMWKKQEKLKKEYDFEGYHTKEDEKDILSWDEERAKQCWEELITVSIKGNWFCPFCIYYEGCDDKCTYGKRHGVCGVDRNNTWFVLKKMMQDKYNIYPSELFSIKECREIINVIEKQDKENEK